jgi:hypothetical protein
VILAGIYLILLLLYFYRWSEKHWQVSNKMVLPLFFMGKIGFALFFLYIYTYHYGGGELTADAGRFFKESRVFFNLCFEHPDMYLKFLFGLESDPHIVDAYMPELSHWNATTRTMPNDSRNVIRINSLLHFISFGEILVHFVCFSFFSFMAALDLAKFLRRLSTLTYEVIVLLLTLFPSIAFWSGSIIKEPLLIVGIFLLFRGVFDAELSLKGKLWRCFLGILLMAMFKPYVLLVLIPILLYHLVIARFFHSMKALIFSTIGCISLAILSLFMVGKLDDGIHIISRQQQDFMNVRDGGLYLAKDSAYQYYVYFGNRSQFRVEGNIAELLEPTGVLVVHKSDYEDRYASKLEEIGTKFTIEVQMSQAGSGIEVTRINESGWTMLRMIPEVLVNVLFRPWPWDKGSWLIIPAFIENVILILLLIVSFIFHRTLSVNEKRIIWSLCLFAVALMLIVGWTTPVLGAIVRYKMPATLALLIIVIIQIDYKRIRRKLLSSI